MNGFYDITVLLNNTMPAILTAIPTGKIGDLYSANSGETLWVQAHNVRGTAGVATLGGQGEDNLPGILQFNINYHERIGPGKALQLADELVAYYGAGRLLKDGDNWVRVRYSDLTPVRAAGGFLQFVLSIYYYSRRPRNVI